MCAPSPDPELTPCPAAASPHQPEGWGSTSGMGWEDGLIPLVAGTGVEWGKDAGIESIYHVLEARSTLIAHEAL